MYVNKTALATYKIPVGPASYYTIYFFGTMIFILFSFFIIPAMIIWDLLTLYNKSSKP